MAGNPNPKMKLLRVWDILRDHSDEDHPISAAEICRHLEKYGIPAERKGIYKDIEILQDYGLDIIPTKTPTAGYFLAERDFEIPEIQLIADAVQAANFITPKKTRQLLGKLESKLSCEQSKDIRRSIYIDNRNKCDNEEIYYSIDVIHKAINAKKKIKFQYCKVTLPKEGKATEVGKELVISPYALTWANDRYYLVGNNAKYDNLIHLRVDKMKQVEMTDEKIRHFSQVSEYKTSFNIADYSKKAFNMFGGKEVILDLRCDDSLIDQMWDKFGRDIYIRNRSDGRFTFSAKALLSEGLVAWILQFGKSVTVISPAELAKMVCDTAKETVEQYNL